MEKRIEDYLHLYIGCDLQNSTGKVILMSVIPEIKPFTHFSIAVINGNQTYTTGLEDYKPILRSLSDMTEEEKKYIDKLSEIEDIIPCPLLRVHKTRHGEQLRYLLKQGFDLFGLIDSNLAINKTTHG